ncbi:4Fe-4S binding protein [bacterium]|nr:4Fe-4S binding protein [bacterium]MDY4581805.1 4Fe-4S binding protein [Candidatus Faecousia sp.]
MKKLAVKKNVECMACLQCVAACSQAFYKDHVGFDESLACIRIVSKGTGAQPKTCIQCGKCMRTCEHEAITQNPKTGVYMINKKKCVGCGKCAEACPMKVIVFQEGNPASKCIACGICAKACPMEVLEIVEK